MKEAVNKLKRLIEAYHAGEFALTRFEADFIRALNRNHEQGRKFSQHFLRKLDDLCEKYGI